MSVLDVRPPQLQRTNHGVADLVAGYLETSGMKVRTDGPDARMRYLLSRPGHKPHRTFRTVRELAMAIELGVADGV